MPQTTLDTFVSENEECQCDNSDPFYSTANQERLRKSIAQISKGKVTAHELIEVEDD